MDKRQRLYYPVLHGLKRVLNENVCLLQLVVRELNKFCHLVKKCSFHFSGQGHGAIYWIHNQQL